MGGLARTAISRLLNLLSGGGQRVLTGGARKRLVPHPLTFGYPKQGLDTRRLGRAWPEEVKRDRQLWSYSRLVQESHQGIV